MKLKIYIKVIYVYNLIFIDGKHHTLAKKVVQIFQKHFSKEKNQMNGIIKVEIFVMEDNEEIGFTGRLEKKDMTLKNVMSYVKKYLEKEEIYKDDFYLVAEKNMRVNDDYIKYFLEEGNESLILNVRARQWLGSACSNIVQTEQV